MKLFISNCTHQTHFFNYKLPERAQPHGIRIKPGAQEVIEGLPEAIRYIIEQHEPYGFTHIKDTKPGFSGMCYSIDKPISSTMILDAHEAKQEDLEDLSQEILENSAASITQTLENTMRAAGSDQPFGEVEVSIQGEAINQETKNPPKLDKKIKVVKEGAPAKRAQRPSRTSKSK